HLLSYLLRVRVVHKLLWLFLICERVSQSRLLSFVLLFQESSSLDGFLSPPSQSLLFRGIKPYTLYKMSVSSAVELKKRSDVHNPSP
ncbi:hypothetical protein CSUI_009399, partial [Cystoisospora suis]